VEIRVKTKNNHLIQKKGTTTMKTTYQKPEMKVFLVSTKHMLCQSLAKSNSQTVSDNNAVLSRERRVFWDDEEE
jgi:hypothetical protein